MYGAITRKRALLPRESCFPKSCASAARLAKAHVIRVFILYLMHTSSTPLAAQDAASSRARVSAATATALATISTAVDAPAPSPGAHRLGQRHPHRAAPGSSQLQLLSCHHRCQWATSLPHVTSASRAPSASPPSFTAVTPAPSPASQCFCFQQNKHLHGDCAGLTGLSVSQGVWAVQSPPFTWVPSCPPGILFSKQ